MSHLNDLHGLIEGHDTVIWTVVKDTFRERLGAKSIVMLWSKPQLYSSSYRAGEGHPMMGVSCRISVAWIMLISR